MSSPLFLFSPAASASSPLNAPATPAAAMGEGGGFQQALAQAMHAPDPAAEGDAARGAAAAVPAAGVAASTPDVATPDVATPDVATPGFASVNRISGLAMAAEMSDLTASTSVGSIEGVAEGSINTPLLSALDGLVDGLAPAGEGLVDGLVEGTVDDPTLASESEAVNSVLTLDEQVSVASAEQIPGAVVTEQESLLSLAAEATASPAGDLAPDELALQAAAGILADAADLPAFAAAADINPAPGAGTASVVLAPVTALTPSAQEGEAVSTDMTGGKRLDLTQWLSRANLPMGEDTAADSASASGATTSGTSLSASQAIGNSEMLLKNALFARAAPKGDLGFSLPEAVIGEAPTGITPASTKAAVAGAPLPAPADLTATGRFTVPVQISFGQAQWSEAITERTAWLASQNIHTAELQLDPPELGPLQVKITVQQDQAVVSFVTANPQVREALDQTMGRLRDLLQEQGLQLVDAGVSDQRQQQGEAAGDAAEGTVQGADGEPGEQGEQPAASSITTTVPWGVDAFV